MTRLGTRTQSAPSRQTPGTISRVAGVAIAAVALFLGASLLALPKVVPKLIAVNPGVYQVNVEVSGAARSGWLDLGSLDRESTKPQEEIVDQGPVWVFRFSSGRVPAGELVVARDELERNGWTFTVPPDVAERLQAAGFQPSSR